MGEPIPPVPVALPAQGLRAERVLADSRQRLTLVEKTVDGGWRKRLADVLYVLLEGRYGVAAIGGCR